MSIPLAILLAANAAASPAPAVEAPANKPFEIGSISLLQPQELVAERVSTTELSRTIKAIETSARAWSLQVAGGDACVVHVAIRPGHRFRTWAVCESADAATLDAHLATDLALADIAEVTGGTVVFSIQGKAPWASGFMGAFRFPESWQQAAGDKSVEMTTLVDRVWKD